MENNRYGLLPFNSELITPFNPPLSGYLEDNEPFVLLDNDGDPLTDNG